MDHTETRRRVFSKKTSTQQKVTWAAIGGRARNQRSECTIHHWARDVSRKGCAAGIHRRSQSAKGLNGVYIATVQLRHPRKISAIAISCNEEVIARRLAVRLLKVPLRFAEEAKIRNRVRGHQVDRNSEWTNAMKEKSNRSRRSTQKG